MDKSKVYFNFDGGAWLNHKLVGNAKPSVETRKWVFRDGGRCWLSIQGCTYTCTGLASGIIPGRLSVFTGNPPERSRDSGAEDMMSGSENREILHGSSHWMRSFRSTSQSAHTHTRTHINHYLYRCELAR